jgi:hypothetical protein
MGLHFFSPATRDSGRNREKIKGASVQLKSQKPCAPYFSVQLFNQNPAQLGVQGFDRIPAQLGRKDEVRPVCHCQHAAVLLRFSEERPSLP